MYRAATSEHNFVRQIEKTDLFPTCSIDEWDQRKTYLYKLKDCETFCIRIIVYKTGYQATWIKKCLKGWYRVSSLMEVLESDLITKEVVKKLLFNIDLLDL